MAVHKQIIAPSILSADFTRLGEQIAECESAGADWIHVDVMDGHFVPNLTMGPFIVKACRRATALPLDVHLMVDSPEGLLDAFAQAGASHLTVHVETCPAIEETLQRIRSFGCLAGVTLNPETPAGALQKALKWADIVLVMTVHPGYSGQAFLPEMVTKVAEVRRMLDASRGVHPAWLEVDGGISEETLPSVLRAGANAFVAAQAVFGHPQGIAAGVSSLRQKMAETPGPV